MASRSEPKARQAITQLESLTHRRDACHYLALDLSDLSSVEKAARTFLELETRLDVLFCNAGVMVPDKREMTSQGYDLQFGTNVLGHHRFIQLLVSRGPSLPTHLRQLPALTLTLCVFAGRDLRNPSSCTPRRA